MAPRGSAVLVGVAADDGIQALAVGGHDISDVRLILQSALNLQRRGTSFYQLFQVVYLAEVFQRQQVALVFPFTALAVNQIELHAAELCTLAAIGRTAEAILRGIAQSAIADAQGTMHKNLQLDIGHGLMDGGNLWNRQFAGQHHTPETQRAQPAHLRRRAIVGLGGSMKD